MTSAEKYNHRTSGYPRIFHRRITIHDQKPTPLWQTIYQPVIHIFSSILNMLEIADLSARIYMVTKHSMDIPSTNQQNDLLVEITLRSSTSLIVTCKP